MTADRVYLDPVLDENGNNIIPPPPPGYVVRTWPEEGEQWYAELIENTLDIHDEYPSD